MNRNELIDECREITAFIIECRKIINTNDDADIRILAQAAYKAAIKTRATLIRQLLDTDE